MEKDQIIKELEQIFKSVLEEDDLTINKTIKKQGITKSPVFYFYKLLLNLKCCIYSNSYFFFFGRSIVYTVIGNIH